MRSFLLGCVVVAVTACGGSESTTPAIPVVTAASINAASATTPQVTLGQSMPVSVRVESADTHPLAGITVTFTPTSGAALSAVTDATGIAAVTWTPNTLGSPTMTASIAGTFLSVGFTPVVSTSIAGVWRGSTTSGVMAFTLSPTVQNQFFYIGQGTWGTTNVALNGSATGSSVEFVINGSIQTGIVSLSGTLQPSAKSIVGNITIGGANFGAITLTKDP